MTKPASDELIARLEFEYSMTRFAVADREEMVALIVRIREQEATIKRLEAQVPHPNNEHYWEDRARNAESVVETQAATIKRMDEALRPFADDAYTFDSCGKEFVPNEFRPSMDTTDFTIGDLRAARAARKEQP